MAAGDGGSGLMSGRRRWEKEERIIVLFSSKLGAMVNWLKALFNLKKKKKNSFNQPHTKKICSISKYFIIIKLFLFQKSTMYIEI